MSSALAMLAGALEGLRIPYLIGGSLASSAHGVLRATLDVDILAGVAAGQADALCAALGDGWYADAEEIRRALGAGRAFNLIHMASVRKFDVFSAVSEFHFSELARATRLEIEVFGERAEYPVATAEDILLAKLLWYRAGGEVSERQWADITGILEANRKPDFGYLREWARKLGVEALLSRAMASQ
jgi:hypothetical protein